MTLFVGVIASAFWREAIQKSVQLVHSQKGLMDRFATLAMTAP
jgi:ABC-type polysaccharide/polyol phosphate export permease